jgi:transcription elongation factor SPT6
LEGDEDEEKSDHDFADVSESFSSSNHSHITQIFEPSQIRALYLTEDDELIRAQDIPERMQISSSILSPSTTLAPTVPFGPEDIGKAATWVSPQISAEKKAEFFTTTGTQEDLRTQLVTAISFVLQQLFIEHVEVPYIWTHKRDHLSHFDASDGREHKELLELPELWRIFTLGQKYQSLLERQRALTELYTRLNCRDPYYEEEILPRLDSVDFAADTFEWLMMKYKDKKQEESQFQFYDDEPRETAEKRKIPSSITAYDVAKRSVISKLAQVQLFVTVLSCR